MLALIAGEGALPSIVYEASGRTAHVVALEGHPPTDIPHHRTFRIEELGTLLSDLSARGVDEVCFAGAIRRPAIDPARIDAATLPLVPRMAAALASGDDAALRTVIEIFEEAGLAVRAAHDLAPHLLVPAGRLTETAAPDGTAADIARAEAVVRAMGAADLGQACIVCKGQVLAVEAVMGTDWMLNAVALFRMSTPATSLVTSDLRYLPGGERLAKALSGATGVPLADAMAFPEALSRGGILYKAPKPAQDRRVDLPVIGTETVRAAATAALDGIVVKAREVMILDRAETIGAADAAGLFIDVVP